LNIFNDTQWLASLKLGNMLQEIMYDYNDNIKETNSFVSQRKTKMFSFKVLHE